MLLSEILEPIEEKRVSRRGDVEVAGLAYDSRAVGKGFAFFCIKGLVTDGHLYAAQAAESGASVIFIEREPDQELPDEVFVVRVPDTRLALALCSSEFYGHSSGRMKLAGVTGTNGKTTTAFLIENVMKETGVKTGLIGTIENHVAGKVEPVTRTTPESLDLQKLLARMVDEGVGCATMEVSSHALELHRAAGCTFETVVFTNLTQDHLDFHLSIEEYFGAKRKLFEGEDFGAGRTAVINEDDAFGRRLLEETGLKKISFSIDSDSDVRATGVEVTPEGNVFTLEYPGGTLPLKTRLKGRFNVYNCLAAASACIVMGAGADSLKIGLETLAGVPGRFESIDCGQPFNVIVDYAHTPDGVENLLQACREVAQGRVIVVVGCGGDRDRGKRSLMGRVGAELSDLCIITSDNPRNEDPESIIEMILEGVRSEFPPERYEVEVDRRKAIRRAIELARPGDLVAIAGKGHESGQIFASGVIPFDDRQVARGALEEVLGETC